MYLFQKKRVLRFMGTLSGEANLPFAVLPPFSIRVNSPRNKKIFKYKIMRNNVPYFSLKPYVVTRHLNRLVETVQMRGHNIGFYAKLTKISLFITKYSLLCRALHQVDRVYADIHTACRQTKGCCKMHLCPY